MAFYLHRDGQNVPFEIDDLRTMARKGDLRQDEYIYVEAKGEWIGAALVPEMDGAWNIEENEATVAMEIPADFFAGLDAAAAPAPAPEPAPVARAPEPAPAPRAPAPAAAAPAPMAAPASAAAAPAPRAPAGGGGWGGGRPAPAAPRLRSFEEIAADPVDVDATGLLKEGWAIAKPNLGLLIGAMLLLGVVNWLAGFTVIGPLLIGTPLFAGLAIVSLRLIEGKEAAVGNAFDGFKRFVPLMVTGLITMVGVFLGTILLILPGLYFALASMFAAQIVLDRGAEPMDAIKGSMKVVNAHFGKIFLFLVLAGLLNMGGVLACGLGVFVTAPITLVATNLLYKRLFGLAGGYANLA